MRAIRFSFFQMLKIMRRDMMLFAICFAPVPAGFAFWFSIPFLEATLTDWFHRSAIISPYYPLIDTFFAMLAPTMFCLVSAMVSLYDRYYIACGGRNITRHYYRIVDFNDFVK